MTSSCTVIEILRSPKILDMSLFDLAASYIAAILFGIYVLHIPHDLLYWVVWLTAWTAFGVGVHWVLGVPTMMGYYLGVNARPIRKECKSMIE
jgi:hypothetical protein